MNTKHYKGLFGCYAIIVTAANPAEAVEKIKDKWGKYKDGSRKKEHIRPHIIHELDVIETHLHNGLWV